MFKNKYVLTVTMNPAIDHTMMVKSGKEVFSAGGKGIVVSRALKSLKISALATGLMGGKAGEAINKFLINERINKHFFSIKGETRTNITYVNNQRKNARKMQLGPKVEAQEISDFKKHYKKLLKQAAFVIITGRNARGASKKLYAQLIRMAHQIKVKTILDTSGTDLAFGVKACPFLVKVNALEAQRVLRRRVRSIAEVQSAIKSFHAKGAKQVIISMGRKGAIASERGKMIFVTPPSINLKNDVGCGDTMIAGFLYGLLKGEMFKECSAWAVAAATASALSFKPGLVDLKVMQRTYQKTIINKI